MSEKKLGLFLLVALGIGSMIGGGIFNSPTDLIGSANPQATILAWIVGGLGVFTLVLVFQDLALRKPELKGGIYSYAREGFGEFVGYFSAFGYWIGGLLGVVAYFPLFFKTLNSLLPESYKIAPVWVFILSTVALWLIAAIIHMGIRDAGIVNAIVTCAKLLPLALLVVLGLAIFKSDIFLVPDWQNTLAVDSSSTSVFEQVRGAMGTILWCFLGVEAAVVMSGRAVSQKIVGQATMLAFFITLAIYTLVSVLSMGIVDANGLADAATPLADVLAKTVVGGAGAFIVKVGLLVSISGAALSWILLVIELPWIASKDGVMPKWFAAENKKGVPVRSLLITTLIIQVCLFSLLSDKLQQTYNMVYNMSTSTMLIPYLFTGLYACKISLKEKRYGATLVIGILASIYSIFVLYAVGLLYLSLTIILFAVGLIPWHMSRKEKGIPYQTYELICSIFFIIGGSYLTYQIINGTIHL